MSLRQLWVRIRALPSDSPLSNVLREEFAAAEEQQSHDELLDTLTRYKPKG